MQKVYPALKRWANLHCAYGAVFREHPPHRGLAQIARCSERAVGYKTPAALAQLAGLLDRASLL